MQITSREQLREVYPEPKGRTVRKVIDHLEEHCRAFIALSPFVLLSTAGADGKGDVTPRGDAPGFVAVLDDHDTRACTTAERALLAELEAGCSAPVGALAEVVEGFDGPELSLRAVVTSPDGTADLRRSLVGDPATPADLGRRLALAPCQ